MDMEDMRTDPIIYIDQDQFAKEIIDSIPTLFFMWLFSDYYKQQNEEVQQKIISDLAKWNNQSGSKP